MGSTWKVGDWAVFDMAIVQIKEIRDQIVEVSTGVIATSGRLSDRLRPLTLQNKVIAESFDYQYRQLKKIKGERGFNYPDINRYFCQLMLNQIDGEPTDDTNYKLGNEFVQLAGEYTPVIHGVELFRA